MTTTACCSSVPSLTAPPFASESRWKKTARRPSLPRQAQGWRYITLQVVDIDAVHDGLRSNGVREGLAPITLGDVARISMILDPDGNWIELSRRASIVGSLN